MNYLAPLTVIADRLREKLPPEVTVRVAVDLTTIKSQASGAPEVWVLLNRDIVQDTADTATLVEFQVAAVLVVPGLLPDMSRDGALLTTMTTALAGYRPPRHFGLSPCKRVGSLVPQTWSASLVAYGMLISTVGML